jgi:hypothetical protein
MHPQETWRHLLNGPLLAAGVPWPLTLRARLGDLRPRFLPKGPAGRGFRAVARNGRVLLASDRPASELAGRAAEVRLQTWHRVILSGEAPRPWGVLLCVRCLDDAAEVDYVAQLGRAAEGAFDLALEVGGGMRLQFRRAPLSFSGEPEATAPGSLPAKRERDSQNCHEQVNCSNPLSWRPGPTGTSTPPDIHHVSPLRQCIPGSTSHATGADRLASVAWR